MNLQGKCFKDAFTYFQIKPSFALYIMIARPWAESRIFNTKNSKRIYLQPTKGIGSDFQLVNGFAGSSLLMEGCVQPFSPFSMTATISSPWIVSAACGNVSPMWGINFFPLFFLSALCRSILSSKHSPCFPGFSITSIWCRIPCSSRPSPLPG